MPISDTTGYFWRIRHMHAERERKLLVILARHLWILIPIELPRAWTFVALIGKMSVKRKRNYIWIHGVSILWYEYQVEKKRHFVESILSRHFKFGLKVMQFVGSTSFQRKCSRKAPQTPPIHGFGIYLCSNIYNLVMITYNIYILL